jgi:predicted nucleic acid-binding protein
MTDDQEHDQSQNRVSFIDTNVLVYAHDRSEARKQPIAQALLDELWRRRTGALSTQVLQEFYTVATRKFDPPLRPAAAREIVALYSTWPTVQVDVALILAASKLDERHSISFWDALIVEAARRAGATRLLTEDLQTGRQVGGVQIENPFIEPERPS